MKIKILGTRGEIDESAKNFHLHSGVLIDEKILIDCGESEFLSIKHSILLVTHLHPDHAFFVRDRKLINEEVIAPEKFNGLQVKAVTKEFVSDGYRITPIPTEHSLKVKSQAYLIEHMGKKILYTGDMIWIDKKYWPKIGKVDMVITDGSFVREGGRISRHKITGQIYGHGGIPNLIRFFDKFTKKILFVHFGGWFYKNIPHSIKKIQQLGKDYQIRVTAAHDGLIIEL